MTKRIVVAQDIQKFRKVLDGHHYVDCECGAEVRVPIGCNGFKCPACGDWATKEKAMNVKPLQNRAIVKQIQLESVTKSGIIIPEQGQERPLEGTIVAIGEGLTYENGVTVPMDVKVGDHILYEKYKGTNIEIEGEKYLILRESDILGVVEDD